MKKLIISGVFCSVLLLGGFQVASAEETTTTSTSNAAMLAKIQDLMKLIADLKAKLAAAQGEVQVLVADLEEGAQGEDVKKVQEVLATDPTIFGAKPTGYFGPMTREALKKFQDRYGLEVTGKLDEGTREAIKELRKDGQVAPGLLKSEAVKDRIKSRLQDKWQNCDFTRPFRASLCEKVKDHQDKGKGKDMDDEDDSEDDEDDTDVTRDDARRAVVDAQNELNQFRDSIDDMEDDDASEDEIDEATDTFKDAQKEMVKARRALAKGEFDDAYESAQEVIDTLDGDDSSDDSDDDDSDDDEDEDEDDEDDEDEDDD